ncbi:PAS domain S-box protein [Pseudomonas aeruginosa]|nr:PAS domain S-box protein [Pseudomonas aeruginosa]
MPIAHNLSKIFTQTLEQAVDSVVVIDTENNVVLFNRAAETLWGYSRDEVLGRNVKMLVPLGMQSDHDDYINENRRTGVNKIVGSTREVPIHRKDGSQRWGAMSISRRK